MVDIKVKTALQYLTYLLWNKMIIQYTFVSKECCGDRMVVGFTTSFAISVYHHWSCDFEYHSGEVYSIQHYVIEFFSDSDLRQVSGFLWALQFPPPTKTDRHDITKIPLKVVLNTTTLTLLKECITRPKNINQLGQFKSIFVWTRMMQNIVYIISWWNNF